MGAITDNCDNFVDPIIEEEEEEEAVFNENEINGKFKMVSERGRYCGGLVTYRAWSPSVQIVKGERVETESERPREPRV